MPEKTRGSLRGVIEAPAPEAVTTLLGLLDLPEDINAKAGRWSKLAPWRLATTLSFGERKPEAFDVSVDGMLRGGRTIAKANIDGARGDWRAAPADFTASIETPDVDGFLDMISANGALPVDGGERGPGKVFVKAAGVASAGLVAVAEIASDNVNLEFNGRMSLSAGNALAAKGDIRLDAKDLRRVLALAGIPVAPGTAGTPVSGAILAAHDGTRLTLASQSARIGSATVSGVLNYTSAPDGQPATVDVDLSADQASLPALLASISAKSVPVTDAAIALPVKPEPNTKRRQAQAQAAAEAAASAPQSIWSAAAFDLAPLDRINGQVKASFRSLSLEPGLAMKDARLDVALSPGRLEVRRLEGAVLGGKAISAFGIDRQPAGAAITGSLKVNVSSKGSAESGVDDAIEGDVAALSIDFSGKALSPQAMIGAMTGKGQLVIGDVTISGVSPKAVSEVSDAALLAKGPSSGAPLVEALKVALKENALKLGKVTVPVEISDASLKLAPVEIEMAEGRARFDTVLDLQTLRIDSGWKIEGKSAARAAPSVPGAAGLAGVAAVPKPVAAERRFLPPVSVVYTGRLADLAAMEPAIVAEELERELAVRRMERDVDELERIRALDEQRARKERERQEALEAERARQLQLEKDAAPDGATPAPAPGPEGKGNTTGASGPDAAAATPAAAGNPLPEALETDAAENTAAGETQSSQARAPSRPQPTVKKKPPQKSWQPFQISPYP